MFHDVGGAVGSETVVVLCHCHWRYCGVGGSRSLQRQHRNSRPLQGQYKRATYTGSVSMASSARKIREESDTKEAN